MSEQQIDLEDYVTTEPVIEMAAEVVPVTRKSSGFQRMKGRHQKLIAEHEALNADYSSLLEEHAQLKKEHEVLRLVSDKLLGRLEALQRRNGSTPAQRPWFEDADRALASLAVNPDPKSLHIMTSAVAGIQARLSQIILRNGART
jgi:hypothetical protein